MEKLQRKHVIALAAALSVLSTLMGIGKPLADLRIAGYTAGNFAHFVVVNLFDFALTFVFALLLFAAIAWGLKRIGNSEES